MTMTMVSVNGNSLIEVLGVESVSQILDLLGIELQDVAASLDDSCEWLCGVERKWWELDGHQLNLTDEYAVRWTSCDEAGCADVVIVERIDDQEDAVKLGEWLRDIARSCGSSDGTVR